MNCQHKNLDSVNIGFNTLKYLYACKDCRAMFEDNPHRVGVDNVNHPKHYTSHPSGVECIAITEHMGFNVGNAIKYLWRADEKGNALEDLQKAEWYVRREIDKRKKA